MARCWERYLHILSNLSDGYVPHCCRCCLSFLFHVLLSTLGPQEFKMPIDPGTTDDNKNRTLFILDCGFDGESVGRVVRTFGKWGNGAGWKDVKWGSKRWWCNSDRMNRFLTHVCWTRNRGSRMADCLTSYTFFVFVFVWVELFGVVFEVTVRRATIDTDTLELEAPSWQPSGGGPG